MCKCVCIKHSLEDDHQTHIPPSQSPQSPPGQDVPPDIVVSVIRSSSGFFQGTLSAVSTVSGHIQPQFARMLGSALDRHRGEGDPPPYEAPPSYNTATRKPCMCLARSVTV